MPIEAIVSVSTPSRPHRYTVRDIQDWVDQALSLGFTLDDQLEDYDTLYISRVVDNCYPIECGDHVWGEGPVLDVLVPMHVHPEDKPQEELPFPQFDFMSRDRENGGWGE